MKALKKSIDVVIVMGSKSDLPIMKEASVILKSFGVSSFTTIVSAHRTPELLQKEVRQWEADGVHIIIAGAGGAAHLPGMLAAFSSQPVIGVPVKNSKMNGLDSLLSIAQMPKGVPVATVAVDGAYNAGLLACQILGVERPSLRREIKKYKAKLNKKVKIDKKRLSKLSVKDFLK